MKNVFPVTITAILFTSLTMNVMTYFPLCSAIPASPGTKEFADNTPAQHGFDLMVKHINAGK